MTTKSKSTPKPYVVEQFVGSSAPETTEENASNARYLDRRSFDWIRRSSQAAAIFCRVSGRECWTRVSQISYKEQDEAAQDCEQFLQGPLFTHNLAYSFATTYKGPHTTEASEDRKSSWSVAIFGKFAVAMRNGQARFVPARKSSQP